MATVLEARAIITAEDRTGPAFAAIGAHLTALERQIAMLGRAATHINAISGKVSGLSSQVARNSAATRAASVGAGGAGMGGMGMGMGAMAAGAVGLGGAVAGGVAAHAAVKASAARIHESIRMEASGMSRTEIAEAQAEAAKLAAKFPSIDQTEFLHMLRNARSIVGSYEEAAQIMEPLAKLRIVAQGARPGADVSEDFDQLVKGLEIKGVTQNPKQFKDYMEGIAKGLNVFGDTLKPYQYYEMFKYGRQATPGLSEKFILGTAPTLAQELGGSSYGRAVSAFNSAVVSNVMKHSALKDFARLGLIASEDLDVTKTGEAKGLKPGAHVQGWRLAQSDPNEWVKQYLMPALAKAGVTDKEEILQRIGALFQNQQAGQMVGLLATQQSRIDKDLALLSGAKGLDAARDFMKGDPHIALQGLENSMKSLLGVLGEGTLKGLTPAMADTAAAIAGYTARLEKLQAEGDKHPESIAPAGQDKFNRAMNKLFFGVDSDKSAQTARALAQRQPYGELPDADLDRARSAAGAVDAAFPGYRNARRFPMRSTGGGYHGELSGEVSGAFPMALGSGGYGNYEPATGLPRAPAAAPVATPAPAASGDSIERIREALGNIKATVETLPPITGEATVKSDVNVTSEVKVSVEASAELKATVQEAKQAAAKATSAAANMPLSSTGHSNSQLGPSMSEAAPGGKGAQ